MTERTYKNDMTMMLVMHDALRRELERMARITAHTDDDPRRILQTALGWELFKNYLRVHHNARTTHCGRRSARRSASERTISS
jgi:hypothetical protein